MSPALIAQFKATERGNPERVTIGDYPSFILNKTIAISKVLTEIDGKRNSILMKFMIVR